MSKISLDPETEKKLIKKCRKDKKAFGALYKHYHKYIHAYVVSHIKDEKIAEDIVSLVFQKALKGIDNFKWEGISFSAWLYRIARNTLIDHYRQESKKNAVSIDTLSLATKDKTPHEVYVEEEFYQSMSLLLKDLKKRESTIIYMKFFEGYTNKTIAEILQITETNVGTILHRAIKKLREKIGNGHSISAPNSNNRV